jgi:uncharacterized membrane protein (UPF0127 family)
MDCALRTAHCALSLAMLFLAACTQRSTPPPPPTQTAVQTQTSPRVIFPDGFAVQVEVAADDPTREQGLMFRDRMAEDRGMIFLFPASGVYPFWMKNTIIALDMIWIDDARRVVSVAHDVPPCKADPCPSYPPAGAARYVLETAAGVAKKHRVETGSALKFEGLDNVPVH